VLCVEAVRSLGVVLLLYSAASMPLSIMIFVLFQEGQTRVVSAVAVLMLVLIMALLVVQVRIGKDPSQAVR
jgi:ABC-type Fe3+ transport system permease subunit